MDVLEKGGQIERERGVYYIQLGISLPSNSFPAGRRPLRRLVQLVAISATPSTIPPLIHLLLLVALACSPKSVTKKVSALSAPLPVSYGPLVFWYLQKCHHKKIEGFPNIVEYQKTETIPLPISILSARHSLQLYYWLAYRYPLWTQMTQFMESPILRFVTIF